MATRVKIYASDKYLYKKIQYELEDKATVSVTDEVREGDVIVKEEDGYVSVIRGEDKISLPLPLPIGAITDAVMGYSRKERLALTKGGAVLDGEHVSLTELEHRLLSILYNAQGFVSRTRLIKDLWGEDSDGGVLNVYIYYLRKKLERGKERIILSSRSLGYSLNGEFKKKGESYADFN